MVFNPCCGFNFQLLTETELAFLLQTTTHSHASYVALFFRLIMECKKFDSQQSKNLIYFVLLLVNSTYYRISIHFVIDTYVDSNLAKESPDFYSGY